LWLLAAEAATSGSEINIVTNEEGCKKPTPGVDHGLAVLKAAYEDNRRENERLRDARASVTRQLGPLPLSAAVVAGLVTGFAPPGKQPIQHTWMLWAAGGLFAALVFLSILYSNLKPYRQLRSEKETSKDCRGPTQIVDRVLNGPYEAFNTEVEAEWYTRMIWLERAVRGGSRSKWWEHRAPWRTDSLVAGFDKERTGLVLVQGLFAAVIVFLILARVVT
jgi:hypothetical protein